MIFNRILDYIDLMLSTENFYGKILVLKGIGRVVVGKFTGRGGFFYLEEPATIRKDGLFISVPKDDASIVSVEFDSRNNDILKSVLSRLKSSNRKYFFDIGANIGSISLWTSYLVKDKTTVAIEPIPWLAASLKQSKQRNKLENLIIVNSAISTQSKLELEIPRSGNTYFTTVASAVGRYDKIPGKFLTHEMLSVPVIGLDTLIKKMGLSPKEIALIKIDVEGAEADALLSGRGSLKEGRPAVIFEVWSNEKFREVKAVLDEIGYTNYEHLGEYDYVAT